MAKTPKCPKCPKCGAPLETVTIEEYHVISWNPEEGCFEDSGQSTGTAKCGSCGKPIGGYGQENWGFYPEFER